MSRTEQRRRAAAYGVAAGVVAFGWTASICISQQIEPTAVVHDCALFLHLASVVVGMGAVLTLDWFAARWLLGHHERSDVMGLVGSAHAMIWLGLLGLTASGALLQPDIDATMTPFKLVAVLVIALNGLHAHALQGRLETAVPLTGVLLLRTASVAAISQVGWWTALVIGFVNSR